jgi:hypothetical protein
MTKIWVALAACTSLAIAPSVSTAQGKGQKPDGPKAGAQGGGEKGGGAKQAKHQHHKKNGHQLLGAKLKQDGNHVVGKFKNRDVAAQVKGGKVVTMTAGDLQPKRVRTKTKMAFNEVGLMRAAWTAPTLQLAQYETYYYGYCFDDGYDFDCYWYPAEDVYYEDYTWDEYDPYW